MALSKEQLAKLKVGQGLFMVCASYRNNSVGDKKEVTVTKIGNKYFYVNTPDGSRHQEKKFDKNSSREVIDSNYEASVYINEMEYDNEVKVNSLWNTAWRLVKDSYSIPKHLTIESLEILIDILTPPTE